MGTDGYAAITDACGRALGAIDQALLDLQASPADVEAVVGTLLGNPADLVVRPVPAGVQLIFLDTIVDTKRVEEAVVRPLVQEPGAETLAAQQSAVDTYGDVANALLGARVVVVRPGSIRALDMDDWPERSITEPPAEIVPQGPHAGFVEHLKTNLGLLRERIRDPRLRWRKFPVGTRSGSFGALVYIEGLARPELLLEVERRLRVADPSFATDTSMFQEWLTNVSGWLFPTMESTERPDVATASLLEGRVAVLVDGSPVAVMAPTVFAHLIQTPMDYYNRSYNAVLKRLLRLGALVASLITSALFVALVTVNQELLPSRLFVSITANRLGVPLPVVAEVLAMEVVVDVVREASLRMPGAIGQTISVVGAVVIGQSAVMAGLISAPVVVVVATTFIASAAMPSLDTRVALRALRYPLIFLAALFGIFGLTWGLMVLFLYLLALESFGVPYLAPLAPLRPRGLQDTLWRQPLTDMNRGFFARRTASRK